METIEAFFEALFWIFLFITLLGLIKPWTVLWFTDFKNRKYVLIFYGSATGLIFVILKILAQL